MGPDAASLAPEPTARSEVRDLVAEIVAEAVRPLGAQVFKARSWPLTLPTLPAVLVYGWDEQKTSASASSTHTRFAVSLQMVVQAAVSGIDAVAVEADAEAFAGAIVSSVLTAPGLLGWNGAIERVSGVKTTIEIPKQVDAGKESVGEVSVTFTCEWAETYDVAPPEDGACTDCEQTTFSVGVPLSAPLVP
jgi:hypothetical protein